MNTFHYHDSSLLCIRHCCNNTKKIRSFSSSSSFPHYVEARQVLFMSTLPFPIYPALPSPEKQGLACPALPSPKKKTKTKRQVLSVSALACHCQREAGQALSCLSVLPWPEKRKASSIWWDSQILKLMFQTKPMKKSFRQSLMLYFWSSLPRLKLQWKSV